MYQPWIFATTLAAGGSLVAYAVTQPGQESTTTKAPEATGAVHLFPPAPPAPIAEPSAKDAVLELEPVVIVARHRQKPAAAPQAAEPTPDVMAERPCSNWRDLGPTHVMSGTPSGELAVRALCP